jgi:hypothetical protein
MTLTVTTGQVSQEKNQAEAPVDDFLWGAAAIGKPIRRTKRQTHHLLERGLIKSARKIGGLWCANRAALLREFGALGGGDV